MMLPVVKLEQLKVFSCDECSFVSDDKLATQQHQTSSHLKELREAKPQLGQISDTVRKKDSSLLACQTHFERRSIKKENMLECVLCDQTFPSKDPLKEHLLQVHVQGIQPVAVPNSIQCCICALRFDSKAVLIVHLQTVHSILSDDANTMVDEQISKAVSGPVQLPIAKPFEVIKILRKTENFDKSFDEDMPNFGRDENYNDEDFFRGRGFEPKDQELPSNTPDPADAAAGFSKTSGSTESPSEQALWKDVLTRNSCQLCNLPFEGVVPDLVSHYQSFHKSSTECFLCGKSFTRRDTVQRHLRRSHGLQLQNYQRPAAGRLTKQEVKSSEAKSETKPTWNSCLFCSVPFEGEGLDLESHYKTFHKSLTDCFLCGKSFTRKVSVRRHLSHSHRLLFQKHLLPAAATSTKQKVKTRKTKCLECDRMFSSIPLLAQHLKKDHHKDRLGIAFFLHDCLEVVLGLMWALGQLQSRPVLPLRLKSFRDVATGYILVAVNTSLLLVQEIMRRSYLIYSLH